MKEFVINLLKTNLSPFYYYHNYEHTLYVTDNAFKIAKLENCTAKEIELLTAATLWHDAGFINIYINHEEESCSLAQKYLPGYGYSTSDINKISEMIMATKIPQSPKNKLEQIIADADLEYLGTGRAAILADNLFRELQYVNPSITKSAWDQMQISFLQKHHYFTKFCKENREPAKMVYLNTLVSNAINSI